MQRILLLTCLLVGFAAVNCQNSAQANIIAQAASTGGIAEAIAEAAAAGSGAGGAIAEGVALAQADGNGDAAAAGYAQAIVDANVCACPAAQGIAQAIAEALVTVGPEAQATASALAQAQATGGCGSIATVLASAQAIAVSLGEAEAFANSVAIVGVSECLPSPPATPSRAVAVVSAIANPSLYGGVLVTTLNEAEGNARSTSEGIATALLGDTELIAQGLGEAIANGGSVSVVSESLAQLAEDGNVETLGTSFAEIAGEGQAVAVAEAIVLSASRNLEVTAQAVAEALSDSENGVAVSEAIAEALATQSSTGLVEAITQAVSESIDGGNAVAVGRAIASLAGTGNVVAVAEVIAAAIEGGLAEAATDAVAEAVCFGGFQEDPQLISAMAQAVAEAASNSVAVAEAMGEAIAVEAENVAVAAAEAFAEAIATENSEAFVTGFARTVAEFGSCDTVAEALGQATTLGAGEAVAQVQALAECVQRPAIQLTTVQCGVSVRDCKGSTADCCLPNLAEVVPGQVCEAALRPSFYAGVCSNNITRVVLQPSRAGSGCFCPLSK